MGAGGHPPALAQVVKDLKRLNNYKRGDERKIIKTLIAYAETLDLVIDNRTC